MVMEETSAMNKLATKFFRHLVPLQTWRKLDGMAATFATIPQYEIPEPPRKPLTPYFKFMNERRSNMHQSHPDWSTPEILRHIAGEWKALSLDEKKPYQETYAQEITEFKASEEKWWSNLTEEQKDSFWKYKHDTQKNKVLKRLKKKLKLLGKPKKPPPAFLLYASQQAKENEKSQNSFDNLLQSWKDLPTEVKQSYMNIAKQNLEKYTNELYAWEFRMMKEGHGDLLRQINLKQRSSPNKKKS